MTANTASPPHKSPTANNSPYLLHVGNLYPHKNMDLLLSALSTLKKNVGLEIPLVIAGKPDYFYKKFQKKAGDFGLGGQVIFLQEVSDAHLQILYQNALALVSPSVMEGFDLPCVEAMANNCLVLASGIPVHEEICAGAAIFFDIKRQQDLVEKIKEIYNNGKQKYKQNLLIGQKRASQFSWEQMARLTLKIYESI